LVQAFLKKWWVESDFKRFRAKGKKAKNATQGTKQINNTDPTKNGMNPVVRED
jgi:hypothetical protein